MFGFGGQHPEKKKGEKFIGNMTEERFRQLAFRTKRKGKKALNPFGQEYETDTKYYPIFVQEKEFDQYEKKRKRYEKAMPFPVNKAKRRE